MKAGITGRKENGQLVHGRLGRHGWFGRFVRPCFEKAKGWCAVPSELFYIFWQLVSMLLLYICVCCMRLNASKETIARECKP